MTVSQAIEYYESAIGKLGQRYSPIDYSVRYGVNFSPEYIKNEYELGCQFLCYIVTQYNIICGFADTHKIVVI